MQIVIDIPDDLYMAVKNGLTVSEVWHLRVVILNGTVLQKGHGRLIDADAFIDKCAVCEWLDDISVDEFNTATPTIIEADKQNYENDDKEAPLSKGFNKDIRLLINKLSKMPSMVIETAYLYATKLTLYGVDVTEKWITATQNASALEKAYSKGYYDALQREKLENSLREQKSALEKIRAEIEEHVKINQSLNVERANALCWCLDVIDKYNTESDNKCKK